MRSTLPKVMHEIGGRPLLWHVLDVVEPYIASVDPAARTVVQDQQLGTGHAVRLALEAIDATSGTVVVVAGDVPLLAPATLRGLVHVHATGRDDVPNAATVLS